MKNQKLKVILTIMLIPIILLNAIVNVFSLGNNLQDNYDDSCNEKNIDQITDYNVDDYLEYIDEYCDNINYSIEKTNKPVINVSLDSEIIEKDDVFNGEFLLDKNIVDYYFVSEGITVINENQKTDNISYLLKAEGEFGRFELLVDYGDGEYQKKSIYTYTTAGKTFISDSAEDDAWNKALYYKYETGLISKEEMEDEYGVLSRRSIVDSIVEYKEPSMQNNDEMVLYRGANTYVNGNLFFVVKTTANTYVNMPLKFIKIELRDKEPVGSKLLDTTYTDVNGNYSFSFENDTSFGEFGYDVFIRVYPAGQTFEVKKLTIPTSDYYIETEPVSNVNTGSTTNFSFGITYNYSNLTRAFYIAQGAVLSQRFVLDMCINFDGFTTISYPCLNNILGVDILCSYFDGNDLKILESDWQYWDTINHEYGHFVHNKLGLYDLEILDVLINDPMHTLLEDHLERSNKNHGMRLAYTNGRNPQITKTFDAGVPYLVIVSAYNPANSSSVGSFYVDFE